MKLTNEIMDRLIPWFGYGDFPKANIIFLGDEEGLGGFNAEIGIKGRCEMYGKDPTYYLNPKDWRDGYWEPSGVKAYSKLVEYSKKHYLSNEIQNKMPNSPFLLYCSRMILALENNDSTSYYKPFTEDEKTADEIRYYKNNKLFATTQGLVTALADLRPVPRKDEGQELVFENLDPKTYLNIFKFKQLTNRFAYDPIYLELRERRAQILKNAFERFQPSIIVSCGDRDSKRRFFEKHFANNDGSKLKFETLELPGRKQEFYRAEIKFQNKVTTVFLVNFFRDNFKGDLKLEGLKDLTEEFIRPIYERDIKYINFCTEEVNY